MRCRDRKAQGSVTFTGMGRQAFTLTCVLMSTILSASAQTVSQDDPPPLKAITWTELDRLKSAEDLGDELKITQSLIESRLGAAEGALRSGNELRMFLELGVFHALIERILERLLENQGSKLSGSQISNLKKLEMLLRSYPPRIELMRRRSFEFDSYLGRLQVFVRDSRSRALEPMLLRADR